MDEGPEGGGPAIGRRPGWHDGSGEVAVHPSSVCHALEGQQLQRPYLVYLEKVRTSRAFIRDCTPASPLAILLFGGQLEVAHEAGYIAVDGWLRVRAPAQTAVLMKALRRALDAALEGAVRRPGAAALDAGPGRELVEALTSMLDYEEAAQRWERWRAHAAEDGRRYLGQEAATPPSHSSLSSPDRSAAASSTQQLDEEAIKRNAAQAVLAMFGPGFAAQAAVAAAGQAAIRPGLPGPASGRSAAATAAAAVAAAGPRQPGVLMASAVPAMPRTAPRLAMAEVVINNSNPRARNQLTKRAFQQELEAKWKVVIMSKGRYYPPGVPMPASDAPDNDRPLFLRIVPSAQLPQDVALRQHACDSAGADITAIMRGVPRPTPESLPPPAPAPAVVAYPTAGEGWVCLYLGVEAPPEFGAADRVRGPGGSYLAHISSATGAAVALRGAGSGEPPPLGVPEAPLHLHVTSAAPQQLEEAVKLASNLIDTIRSDFKQSYPHLPPPPIPGAYAPPPVPPAAAVAAARPQQQTWGQAPAGTPAAPYGAAPLPGQVAALPYPPPYGQQPAAQPHLAMSPGAARQEYALSPQQGGYAAAPQVPGQPGQPPYYQQPGQAGPPGQPPYYQQQGQPPPYYQQPGQAPPQQGPPPQQPPPYYQQPGQGPPQQGPPYYQQRSLAPPHQGGPLQQQQPYLGHYEGPPPFGAPPGPPQQHQPPSYYQQRPPPTQGVHGGPPGQQQGSYGGYGGPPLGGAPPPGYFARPGAPPPPGPGYGGAPPYPPPQQHGAPPPGGGAAYGDPPAPLPHGPAPGQPQPISSYPPPPQQGQQQKRKFSETKETAPQQAPFNPYAQFQQGTPQAGPPPPPPAYDGPPPPPGGGPATGAGAPVPPGSMPPPPPRPPREQPPAGWRRRPGPKMWWHTRMWSRPPLQYDVLFQEHPLRLKQLVPKPDREAQASEPGAKKILFSDVYAVKRVNEWVNRDWNTTDKIYAGWANFGMFLAGYFVTGALGITLSYHRQLTHRSFQTPKWLEYIFAYCGVLAVQGGPIHWISNHRYHHIHCDTPLDPHSPYEGFWWSHAGWLLDNKTTDERTYDMSNAKGERGEGLQAEGGDSPGRRPCPLSFPFPPSCPLADLAADPFYQHLDKYYVFHVVAQFVVLFALGGWDALIWAGALRLCWVYHVTWFVNSASHVWGYQDYNTGDLSRNCWWVGILAFGEGWHNHHHAFESSARHGLEWWQLDCTWLMICALRELGLATNIKLPTEKQKERLRLRPAAA
eukprot:scaffold1.g5374.t1